MSMLARFATTGGGVATYIEDVFSTYLYTGNGSTQTITNGIDLAGKGGLVWIKGRNNTYPQYLFDTVRGATNFLQSDKTNAQGSFGTTLTSFNSNGFSLGNNTNSNDSVGTYASWTFREQPKFFDVVTYTGDGSNRTIAHNLGSVPGCIIVKRTDTTADWQVYHRSIANTEYLVLNDTAAKATGTTRWNSTTPTATEFSLGTDTTVNANTGTYVAYLFAHDAGGFGQSGSDNVISCGSFTSDGSGNATVTLGYEPQYVLFKKSSSTGAWVILDVARGWSHSATDAMLVANTSAAEDSTFNFAAPNATGFTLSSLDVTGQTYIYIAIRRGPMKTPTTGTSVFAPTTRAGTGATATVNTGILTDAVWETGRSGQTNFAYDRLRGVAKQMTFTSTNGEGTYTPTNTLTGFDSMTGFVVGADTSSYINGSGINYIYWNFRRAPGFFDVVCYTGTGSNTTQTHNLGVVPELVIWKRRSTAADWRVWQSSFSVNDGLYLNINLAKDTDSNVQTAIPTATVLNLATGAYTNASGSTYVAYLFATCPGVSKVGSYTGTGNTLQIDCGFTGGARFVLIKRTDSTGDWYVWDSARGIVAGNDPYLLLNSTAAEVTSTDYVDTYSAGFEISSTAPAAINANGGSFIFLAIA